MDHMETVQQTGNSFSMPNREEDSTTLIYRRQLHDELLIYIRELIINGDLEEDTKIPEKELCAHFGVSRTPLREALKVLAFEGLVVLNHNRGAIVKPLTPADIEDAFPIYSRLEALAGELACQKLSKVEIDELLALHDQLAAAIRCNETERIMTTNEEIHRRIQTASRNRNLVQLLRYVSSRIRRARMAIKLPEKCLVTALMEHEKMMAALEVRNERLLAQAIKEHIENTFRALKEAWLIQHTHSSMHLAASFDMRRSA